MTLTLTKRQKIVNDVPESPRFTIEVRANPQAHFFADIVITQSELNELYELLGKHVTV